MRISGSQASKRRSMMFSEKETFQKKVWGEKELVKARFVDCTFEHCNFSLTKLDGCRLQNAQFINCKFMGLNFGKCDPTFLKMAFKNCLIATCNFSDLDLKNTLFLECKIRETYFTSANLSGADFKKSDLEGSVFHNTDLRGADFRGAINYSINPLTNKLQKAKFSKPEVMALLEHLEIAID